METMVFSQDDVLFLSILPPQLPYQLVGGCDPSIRLVPTYNTSGSTLDVMDGLLPCPVKGLPDKIRDGPT